MKKISFLLAIFALISFQAMAQNEHKRLIKEISEEIKNGANEKAIALLSELKTPELTDKEARFFVCYSYLKFYYPDNLIMSEKYIEGVLDTISTGVILFNTMPERGILFFTRNTMMKVMRNSCQLIDKDAECFYKLEKFYKDTLVFIKNSEQNEDIATPSIKITEIQNYDSLMAEKNNRVKKLEEELDVSRKMLGDTIKKTTERLTNTELKKNAPEALNDSVYLDITVYTVDSIKLQTYLVSEKGTVSGEYSVSEYCNEKVNSYIKNGVYEILRRWSLISTDTLKISASIIGEADDIWLDTTQLHTFSYDCYGIGSQMGLKVGDKISNEKIAELRVLNAKNFMEAGVKITEAEIKKIVIVVKLVSLQSVDWKKDQKEQKGPEFRKETITLVRE